VAARGRRRARERRFAKPVQLNPLALDFSPVVQTLNTNVAQQVTFYKNAKSSRGFTH
jgi:hypothetical protein